MVFIAALFLLALDFSAQSFQAETPYESASVNLSDEAVFRIHIINVGTEAISVYIKRTLNSIPADWSSSLCFTYCFSPSVDSIATTRDFGSGPIAPGDTVEVSLHVFTGATADTGRVNIKVASLENSAESVNFSFFTTASPVGVERNEEVPSKFALEQNYPNPFNPTTTIKYTIPNIGGVETLHATSLQIYNILGEKVATLVNERQSPGEYSVQFDASNLPSGVYFYTLKTGNSVLTKKMILTK